MKPKQFVGLIALMAGLAGGTYLVSENQDIRQNAMIGNYDTKDCSDGSCATEIVTSGNTYFSTNGTYRIIYDSTKWKQTSIPASAAKTDVDNSMFVYKNIDGLVSAYISSNTLTAAEQTQDLQTFGKSLIKNIPLSSTAKWGEKIDFVGMETINVADSDVLKLNYTMTFLGKLVPYSEYVVKGKDHYIEVEVKQLHTPASETAVAALLEGITVDPEGIAQVKGASTSLDETKLAELVKPSVVSILHTYCKSIKVSSNEPLAFLKNEYPFCDGSYGSGFFVNESGIVATNGHVVTSYAEGDIIGGLINANTGVVMFLTDFVRESLLSGGIIADEQAGLQILASIVRDPAKTESLVMAIYELMDSKLVTVETIADNYYVNMGQNPFRFSSDELTPLNIKTFVESNSGQFKATLSGFDFGNMFSKQVVVDQETVKGSDVALIQISDPENYLFPALDLGSTTGVKEGESITIIGYPGIVSGSDNNSLLDYDSSSTNASVTRGIVSAMKKDNDGHNLIQTDASIEHGNSGGPAFNQSGQVIGIATYGFSSQGGNYNFLRDIDDLQQLANAKSIQLTNNGIIYPDWKTGLNYFWGNRYKRSIERFNLVAANYPLHPSVNEYINTAELAIKNGKDVDLLFGIEKTYLFAGAGVLGVMIVITLLALLIRKKKSPEHVNFTTDSSNSGSGGSQAQYQPLPSTQTPIATPVAEAAQPMYVPSTPVVPIAQPAQIGQMAVYPTAMPLPPLPPMPVVNPPVQTLEPQPIIPATPSETVLNPTPVTPTSQNI